MTAFLLSLLSPLTGLWKWIAEERQTRTPLLAQVSIDRRPPTILVTVVNKTKNLPLHVHGVRVHLGLKRYSYFFDLVTDGTATIPPKDKRDFHLPFEDTIVGRHYESKELPNFNAEDSGPSFDGPADLFKAFARSSPEDSWVEIDFNEFTKRRFLQGKLQPLFLGISKSSPPKTIKE
jgi:hypothetical protein